MCFERSSTREDIVLAITTISVIALIGTDLEVRATDAQGCNVSAWGGGTPASGLIANGGFVVGETRHFQCFYREDPLAGCGTGQNSTNAVTVTIAP